jgi:hypothetical protein
LDADSEVEEIVEELEDVVLLLEVLVKVELEELELEELVSVELADVTAGSTGVEEELGLEVVNGKSAGVAENDSVKPESE